MAEERTCSTKVRLHVPVRARDSGRLLAEIEVVKTLGWTARDTDPPGECLEFQVPLENTAWGTLTVPVSLLPETPVEETDYWCRAIEVEPQNVREWKIRRDENGVAMSVTSETYNTR